MPPRIQLLIDAEPLDSRIDSLAGIDRNLVGVGAARWAGVFFCENQCSKTRAK